MVRVGPARPRGFAGRDVVNGYTVGKMKVSYEPHAQAKDRWNIERVYQGHQKEDALEAARALNAESHIQAVKLFRETYNEAENSSSEVVIFDTTKDKTEPEPAAAFVITRPKTPEPKPAPKPQASGAPKTKARPKPMGPSSTVLALVGGAALVVLLGAWYLLANGAALLRMVDIG